jgi:hypothetical protein
MDGKKSKETQAWEDQLLHPHRDKHGRRPRAAGAKIEEKIPRAEPSHGISAHSSKDNSHGHACPLGKRTKKATGSVIGKDTHPECYEG